MLINVNPKTKYILAIIRGCCYSRLSKILIIDYINYAELLVNIIPYQDRANTQ